MNAYTPPRPLESFEDRTIRHLQMCRELAELGAEMARNTAQAAREEWHQAQPHPQPAKQAENPTPKPTRPQPDTDAPKRETASPSLAFARITNAVRQVIALEATIAARYKADLDRIADKLAARAYRAAEAQPTALTPRPTHTPPDPKIPSLLANIGREIGIDLQDPTLATRLPSFHHPP